VQGKKLSVTEIVAIVGGALLALGVFLDWYSIANQRASIGDIRGERGMEVLVSGFDAHLILRWLLLAAAAAPFILAYIIIRGHKLSWARGELTAVVSVAAFGLVAYKGLIDRPGEPNALIGLEIGWFVAMAGVLLMLVGSSLRASSTERPRKPPGVL
jgi:hypothetical protein